MFQRVRITLDHTWPSGLRPLERDLRRLLGRMGLWLMGWRLVGEIPAHRRAVVIGYPHTSNYDFPMMLLLSWALNVSFHWVGKVELFEGPFGWVYRALQGIPIQRNSRTDTVFIPALARP